MADHKVQHKHSAPSVQNLRAKQREAQIEIRKNKRDSKFNAKRVRLEDVQKEEISLNETEAACRTLVEHGQGSEEALQRLKRAFTQGPEYIDVLFKVDNCLQSLVGILTGSRIESQEQAAWCLTNVATGRPEHALAVAKAAAPYFITYVSGCSPVLQDQCAWALGNIAGDSVECRQLLYSQGCLPPLVKLLESPNAVCVRSAAFAISNLIRELPDIAEDAVRQGVLPILLQVLSNEELPPGVQKEAAWVMTYLTCGDDSVREMVKMGFLPVVVDMVVHCAMTGHVTEQGGELLTPTLRTLGNICTGPDDFSIAACENPRLMPALLRLLQCPLTHVVKETVWVISNMTSDYSVSQSVAYGPMLRGLLEQLDKGHDIQIETMYTLCNMASHGETVSAELVAHGAVAKVVPLLKNFDLELLHMALAFLEATLRYSDNAVFMVEECGGVKNLEQLEHHPNQDIQLQAQEIVDTYFTENTALDQ